MSGIIDKPKSTAPAGSPFKLNNSTTPPIIEGVSAGGEAGPRGKGHSARAPHVVRSHASPNRRTRRSVHQVLLHATDGLSAPLTCCTVPFNLPLRATEKTDALVIAPRARQMQEKGLVGWKLGCRIGFFWRFWGLKLYISMFLQKKYLCNEVWRKDRHKTILGYGRH